MPKITEILEKQNEKPFKKRSYRSWNLDGSESKQKNETPDQKTGVMEQTHDVIHEMLTNDIKNWVFHDRPESELGDISALASDFLNIGQQQPCIVRPIKNSSNKEKKYELIVGERRWRAAKVANLQLKVIIKDLSDSEAALIQATENDNRKDLSDFAKGMSFSRLIQENIIKQKDLITKLGKSKQYVSALLSFSKIPSEIIDAIGDMSKVSSKTAEAIKQLTEKGPNYIEQVLTFSDKLRDGKIGHSKLSQQVKSLVENKINEKELNKDFPNLRVINPEGRHIFTWRQDNNDLPSIHFPKNIVNYLNKKDRINHLTDKIRRIIEEELKSN